MPADPIAPVINALSVLVTPNPAAATGAPSQWEAPHNATDASLFGPIQTLLTLIFGASTDIKTTGQAIHKSLTDVAGVVQSIADGLAGLPSATDAMNAMNALQQGLALAQTLAPGGASTVLSSGSALFTQVQNLLSATNDIGVAAAELAQLSQQLRELANLFPA